jgi:hypothetical protein
MRLNKKAALAAGVVVALGTAGTALASTITISPTIAPQVAPVLVAPSVTDSFNITDSFLLNSHNDNGSEFIDFTDSLNVMYTTLWAGAPDSQILGGLGGLLNISNVLALINLSL